MKRHKPLNSIILALAALFISTLARAQTASVTGTITDASGAVIPGATVKAHNSGTGAERAVTAGETGVYRIPNLPPGHYVISVENEGFATFRVTNVELTVDQVLTLDAKLEVTQTKTTVEVNAQAAAPVNLDDATISNVVDSRRMTDLPLILRDPYQLILLSPGVIQSNTYLGGFSVNGTRERNNNFLLDGVDNNDTDVPGIAGGLNPLNPDSTQEFRVITNNFSPEFGRNNGAIIDVLTKSGTNAVHGDAYWFGRYNALGARDFFNHLPDTPKDPYVRNDFGGSLGGPIRKDKTFWFANYEGQRFVTARTSTSVVPNQAFRTGVFTATEIDSTGQPVTRNIDVSSPTAANNRYGLPLDPTVKDIFALYPSPNGSAVDNAAGFLFFPTLSRTTQDTLAIKLDHHLTNNHTLSGRYAFARFRDPDAFHDDILPGGLGATATRQRTQNLGIDLTSALRPTLVNDLRFGGNRTNLQFNCTGTKTFDSFGGVDSLGRGPDYFLAGVSGCGCLTLGEANGEARFTGTYQVLDGLTWVKNTHTFKFGEEFRDVYSNSFDDFGSRTGLSFAPFFFGALPLQNLPPALLGDQLLEDEVSTLFGLVDTQSQSQFFDSKGARNGDDLRGFRQREYAFYGWDVWKVKPNLTFNYGLRWEHNGVPFEVHNNLSNLFVDPSGPAPFTFTTVGPGAARSLYDNEYKNFEPRVGLAWDPFKNGKTSIRAGYGIYHDRVFGNLFGNARGNPPFTETFVAYPIITSQPTVTGLAAPTSMTPSATVINPDFTFTFPIEPVLFDSKFHTPLSQNWNFGIQRQLTSSLNLEVDYVGVKGERLFREVDGNPPQPGLVSQLETYCKDPNNAFGCVDTPTSSTLIGGLVWYGAEYGYLPFDATNNNAFAAGPGTYTIKSIAASTYHSLQVNLTQRFSHGVQIQTAYTWAHSIDNGSDPLAPAANNRGLPRNSFNLQAERGNSDFDVRQRAVINFIYQPNLGRGRGRLNSGAVGRALEGWQISGVTVLQTGLPYDIFGNRDSQHTGLSDRATIIGPKTIPSGKGATQTGPALSSFEQTPYDFASNLTRNQFFGPGIDNWNVNLSKVTAIRERLKLELRFEFYDLFNRVQFGQPDNLIQDRLSFGQSFTQIGQADGTTGARQIQFGAKLIF